MIRGKRNTCGEYLFSNDHDIQPTGCESGTLTKRKFLRYIDEMIENKRRRKKERIS